MHEWYLVLSVLGCIIFKMQGWKEFQALDYFPQTISRISKISHKTLSQLEYLKNAIMHVLER